MSITNITFSTIVGISFFSSVDGFAQLKTTPKYEVGINAGAYVYQGDLTPHASGSLETVQPGIGISATRMISNSFSLRLMFVYARLAANESIYPHPDWRQQRNFSFSATVKELGVSLHWNILKTNFENDVRFEPYAFAGVAASMINTKSDFSRVNWPYFGERSELQSGLITDVLSPSQKIIPVVPVGAGVRYHVSNSIVLNLEGAYRFMHNDYVDGFSKSGNPRLQDHYYSISIGASYKFGGKVQYGCPAQEL